MYNHRIPEHPSEEHRSRGGSGAILETFSRRILTWRKNWLDSSPHPPISRADANSGKALVGYAVRRSSHSGRIDERLPAPQRRRSPVRRDRQPGIDG